MHLCAGCVNQCPAPSPWCLPLMSCCSPSEWLMATRASEDTLKPLLRKVWHVNLIILYTSGSQPFSPPVCHMYVWPPLIDVVCPGWGRESIILKTVSVSPSVYVSNWDPVRPWRHWSALQPLPPQPAAPKVLLHLEVWGSAHTHTQLMKLWVCFS